MTEEYLWKYLSLDKFVSLLKNNGLYFSTVQHLKTNIDPEECLIIDSYTNNQIVSIQSTLKECFFDDIKQKCTYLSGVSSSTGVIILGNRHLTWV